MWTARPAGELSVHVKFERGRTAFLNGLHGWVSVVEALSDEQLLAVSRCRGWAVGDVVVHVHMGLQDMLLGIVAPSDAEPDIDAASYWRIELPTNDPDADDLAPIRFTRLVASAYRRPKGIVGHLLPTAAGLRRAVSAMGPGAVEFQGHVLTAGDFLATWAVELAVHHLDLTADLDLAPPAPDALRLARETVEALAAVLPEQWSDETAVLIGAGRVELTDEQAREAGAAGARLPALG